MKMDPNQPAAGRVRFGTAGNSDSFSAHGHKTTVEAPAFIRQRGLDAYELAFGRGVFLRPDRAEALRAEAEKNGVTLSVHAPYYINLANPDRDKILRSFGWLLDAARAAAGAGAEEMVLHLGSGVGQERREALGHTERNLREAIARMEDEGLGGVRLCPETMGRPGQIGSLEEILYYCEKDERLIPCVDFAHLHAITQGGLDSREAFARVLDRLEKALGTERARRTHLHFSAIQYGASGEIRHRTFAEEGYGPDFGLLAPELAERGFSGILICECAGTQAEDAKAMRDMYDDCLERCRAASGRPSAAEGARGGKGDGNNDGDGTEGPDGPAGKKDADTDGA